MDLNDLVCKCCTAPLDPSTATGRTIRCKYCGTVLTMAREETKAQSFLSHGEHDLDTCRFDDAYAAYQKAAELDKEEPEAYFGMALASFKVQYLKDEASDLPRLQPVVHGASEKVFSEDKNYLRALSLASEEQREQYETRAKEIDRIREEFLSFRESGLDYDCFLCVKVTDGGKKTEDAVRASEIYFHLKELGYHPFYSEHEIKGREGSDYEALILYALYSSECMLIVCSDEEYLQTKWVKNEYTRFLRFISEEEKRRDSIAVAFVGTPVERLPGKEGKIQGIDLSRPDAYTRIENFVRSHTPDAQRKREDEAHEKEESRRQIAALEEEFRKLKNTAVSASDYEESENGVWKIENGVLKKYSGTGKIAVVPRNVEAIGDHAFSGCKNLTEVKIGDGVASIGQRAFSGCIGLLSITVPESVKEIGERAFEGCISLQRAALGGAMEIPHAAFVGCSSLKGIAISSRTVMIGPSAFEGCVALTAVGIPNGVKIIGSSAFRGCTGLKVLEIPESVTRIDTNAFAGCSRLTRVTIPSRFKGLFGGKIKKLFGKTSSVSFTFTK